MSVHTIPTYERRRPEETLLYKTIAGHLNTFIRQLAQEDRRLPSHVEKELFSYLDCGVLAYGFMRLKCGDCRSEQLVAFSCKKRGFCPSCGGKRMSETSTHLVEHIIPRVPIRQYVLSLPHPLRYWMASNKKLCGKVHKILARTVEDFYCDKKDKDKRSGSIAFIQRFGEALNLNIHLHMLQIEGCYHKKTTNHHKFIKDGSPQDKDIVTMVDKIRKRVIRLLIRQGYLQKVNQENSLGDHDPLFANDPTYASVMSCSVQNRIALGDRRGERVRFIGPGFGYEGSTPRLKGSLCAESSGFSLHAGVLVKAYRRDELRALIGYVSRPSLWDFIFVRSFSL